LTVRVGGASTQRSDSDDPAGSLGDHAGLMLTRRALAIGLAFGVVAILWVRQVELVKVSCQVSESVPPVPAVACLVLGAVLLGAGQRAGDWLTANRKRLGRPGLVLLAIGLTIGSMDAPWASGGSAVCVLLGGIACFLGFTRKGADMVARHLVLTRAEVLAVYVFVAVVPVFASVGVARILLPCITALPYFKAGTNHFEELSHNLPAWYGPQDPEAIRQLYEGVDVAARPSGMGGIPLVSDLLDSAASLVRSHTFVPWGHWAVPGMAWSLFLLAFFLVMLSCVRLVRSQWSDRERLGYPIVQFALDMTQPGGAGYATKPFFRDPLMWMGVLVAVLFNGINLLSAINPSVPAPGQYYNIGALFTEHPLNSLAGLSIAFRPELVGLGYLVSLEVLLSVWVFYLLTQVETVMMASMGLMFPGYPFAQEQSAGAYLAMGLFLAWGARGPVVRAARALLQRDADAGEGRWLLIGAGSAAFLVLFCVVAGMSLWLAALYMGILVLFAIVYARARAEAGAPMVWLFPFWQQEKMIRQVFGVKTLAPGGDFRSATVFSSMMWLSRGYYPSLMATQLEGFRIGDLFTHGSRDMTRLLVIAAVLGIVGSGWMHLTTYYDYGGNVLEGGSTQGGYRISLAVSEYTDLDLAMQEPTGPDRARTEAHIAGAALTAGLLLLHRAFLRFPLHPLGFAMATAYGQPMWAAFLFVWIVKSAILRIGGIGLYRRLIPLFLGIAFGHFFGAGVMLGTAGIWGGEIFTRYMVHFG